MKLYFASGNEHKKIEMEKLLEGYTLILPKDEGFEFDPIEDGSSFIENAIIKAEALFHIVKAPCLADDSGLCVDAFNGKPGIHTARYGEDVFKRKLDDREKYMFLLKNMENIENRKATFVCAICLILDENRRYIIQESVNGHIAEKPEGTTGFGYDPVFYNDDAGMISACLAEGEKNRFSHRGKAARIIKDLLDKEFGNGKE